MLETANPNLYVITGGPGSGKTTLLQELSARGFPSLPEVAREIIQEQIATGGHALPWADRSLYASLMLQRSIESFLRNTPTAHVTFADRGIPDTLCYASLIELPAQNEIQSACHRYRYAPRVFIAPPWPEIYRTDNERKQDFAEAVRTHALMKRVYHECGYQLIDLPKTSPAERADFIVFNIPRTKCAQF